MPFLEMSITELRNNYFSREDGRRLFSSCKILFFSSFRLPGTVFQK